MTATETLRAAATKLREWAAEPSVDRWAPGAVQAFGPALADWLESAARLIPYAPADHALTLARAVLGEDCPGTRKETHDA